MASRINVKLVLELLATGMSQNSIASSWHISKHSVAKVADVATQKGISFDDVRDMPELDVYRIFFPNSRAGEDVYAEPDYQYVHAELKRV